MKTIEIELRYEVVDINQLTAFTTPLTQTGSKRVIDIYLDTQEAALLKKGVYIRVRNGKELDIKFNRDCLNDPTLELQPYCEEYSFTLPLGEQDMVRLNEIVPVIGLQPIGQPSLELFKQANALIEHRIVDKKRTSYAYKGFNLAIDEVVDLGTFLEIELMAENTQDLPNVKKAMEDALCQLSLKPLTTGYSTLVLRKHNFAQYLQSRFILEEDKKYRIHAS